MSPPFFLSFPLLILLFSFHSAVCISANHLNLVQQTCKSCSETDPNISYKFCITSLQADPRSHCVKNLHELGLNSIKLIRRNVTDTGAYIKELLKKKKKKNKNNNNNNNNIDPFIKQCLDDCLGVYSDSIPTLREAIKDFKAKRYADCNVKVSSVVDASTTCEDGFKEENGVVSPLTKRNNDTFQLSAIALSIINMLNNGKIN